MLDPQAHWAKPFIQLRLAVLLPFTGVKGGGEEANITSDIRLPCLTLQPAKYPGVSFIELHPGWSAYDMLILVVYVTEAEPIKMVIRIHDRRHNQAYSDRFNRAVMVEQGENVFRIHLVDIKRAPGGEVWIWSISKISHSSLWMLSQSVGFISDVSIWNNHTT